ncbi:MAG: ABC transporter permease [Streptosporangiaceae bacterium]|nr:ABC transporter permease [Streptosporangiaceae bacterium]MBV9857079.1 ABC transporter permease [Streptosporangiaceae bacterium]
MKDGFAGTGALARLALRRDRIMLPVWVYVITVAVVSTAYSLRRLYPTVASRASLAVSGGGNPALRFLYGRLNGSSAGALTAWRYGVWAGIFAALMTVFIVIRHTRADEEAGRLELAGSAAVGRHAALTAGLLAGVTADVVLAVLLSVALPLTGLPAAGSVAMALATAACGLAFGGIAAVAAQLSGARAARGIAIGALGVAFVLRAAGDSAGAGGPSWLTWLSPLGWTQLVRPFAGERWWALALPVTVAAACGVLAFVLAARRDHGAGLLPGRPGRPAGSVLLSDPFGLAWRLQRGVLAAWAFGFAATFAVSGAAAKGIGSLLGGSTALKKEFVRLGGQAAVTNAYLAALMFLAGLVAAGYAISAVLRLRSEETAGLAEPVLATAAGRVRWALGHMTIALLGTAFLLAVAGVSAALGYALRAGSPGPGITRMLGAAIAQLPASMAVAGVAVLLFGVLPSLSVAGGWAALGVVLLIGLFGQVLSLSHWVMDISPFTHVPKLPGGTVAAAPLLWLCLAAVVLGAAGLAGLRRRDIA